MTQEERDRRVEALEACGRDVANTMTNRASDLRRGDADAIREGIRFSIACCEIALYQAQDLARDFSVEL